MIDKYYIKMALTTSLGKSFRYSLGPGYRLCKGQLPLGIHLDSELGLLLGRPKKVGTYTFTLKRKCEKTELTIIVKQRCKKLIPINTTIFFCQESLVQIFLTFSGNVKNYLKSATVSTSIRKSVV